MTLLAMSLTLATMAAVATARRSPSLTSYEANAADSYAASQGLATIARTDTERTWLSQTKPTTDEGWKVAAAVVDIGRALQLATPKRRRAANVAEMVRRWNWTPAPANNLRPAMEMN